MKIVFVSDTHGSLSELRAIALREYDADAFFHLGDIVLPPEEIDPFLGVKGNCDPSIYHYPSHRFLTLPSGRLLYMRHHPLDGELENKLFEEGYSYFLHGHTHRPEDILAGKGLRSLCPGSPIYPRGGSPSYLVLNADIDGEEFIIKPF